MNDKGKSTPTLLGGYTHYDEKGHKTGSSTPGLFGGYTNYDSKGNKIGRTDPGLLGGYNHYDNHGKKIGSSDPGLLGGYHHYDASRNRVGSSNPGVFGSYHHSSAQGCYIATCVYGSYDCPEVWTLRRFRDDTLAQSRPGRAFIHAYYAISPALVRLFGKRAWFQRFWRNKLDRLVGGLREQGVENTPYQDKSWT